MTSELAKTLTDLREVFSPQAPVLSVVLNLYPERLERRSLVPRLKSLLQPIRETAFSGELDHRASASLRAGLEKVWGSVPDLEMMLERSVALFVCDEIGLDRRLGLPGRVWDSAVAGPTPYLRPLLAVLDEQRKVAAVVLDSQFAEISQIFMGEIVEQEMVKEEELRKSNLAGWYGLDEGRHRRHAAEVRDRLFREVASRLARLRRQSGVEAVFIGGQQEITDAILPFLDARTRAIAGTFVTDLHTLTPAILLQTVAVLEEDLERREETRVVEEMYGLSAAGSLGAVGLDQVTNAANRQAIAELAVHDGATAPGAICSECGAIWGPVDLCPDCGGLTEQHPDVIEALARSVLETSGTIEHVMEETPLSKDLVAARLRFKTS